MIKALWNLTDENGILYAIEKWEWSEEYHGYKVETRFVQGIQDRDWHECGQPNLTMKRELTSQE